MIESAGFSASCFGSLRTGSLPVTIASVLINLLDAPRVRDLAFHLVWSRFLQMRRNLPYRSQEVRRVHGLVEHLIVDSAVQVFSHQECPGEQGWLCHCVGSLVLCNIFLGGSS